MKKALIILIAVIVGIFAIAMIIGAFLLTKTENMPDVQEEEIPTLLAQVDISGGFRMVDSEYIVARRIYSNGVVLEKTNTEEIGIYKELTSEGMTAYQALLEAYTGPEVLGPKKEAEECASWADGIDYSFTFPTKSVEEQVSSCDYELDLTNPLLSPLVD